MFADSQQPTRLTYNVQVIYDRLYRHFGEVIPHEELCKVLHVNRETICNYVIKINKLPGVKVKNIRNVGYVMVEKTL